MAPAGSTTVILPLKLGLASKFDGSDFSLVSHKSIGGMVEQGGLLLSATLDEVLKIKELGIDLSSNQQFLLNTKLKYDDLEAKQQKLEKYRRTLNPFKYILNYRAARLFYAAALSLYNQTMETSERIERKHKEILLGVVPSTEIHRVNEPPSSDASIDAIAIEIPGQLDAEKRQEIIDAVNVIAMHATNPFVDNPHIPQLSDNDSFISLPDTASLLTQSTQGASINDHEETGLLASGSPSFHFYFVNSVLTTGSNIQEMAFSSSSGN